MDNLSTLSNDELFRLLKSSGINAGPITQSTRSVYEKKLKNYLNDATTESPKKATSPVVREPVVELRALDVEPIFVKPATPKAKQAPAPAPEPEPVYQPVQVDKPRRSILRNSVEKQPEPIVQETVTTCKYFQILIQCEEKGMCQKFFKFNLNQNLINL